MQVTCTLWLRSMPYIAPSGILPDGTERLTTQGKAERGKARSAPVIKRKSKIRNQFCANASLQLTFWKMEIIGVPGGSLFISLRSSSNAQFLFGAV